MKTFFYNFSKTIIFTFIFLITIFAFNGTSYSYKLKTEKQNTTSNVSITTIRVFHDGFWWIQIYDSDTDTIIMEFVDPEQS